MNVTLSILQKKSFWVITSIFVVISIVSSISLFTYNNPIALLTISMNRHEALKKAEALTTSHDWPASKGHTAVVFERNTLEQFFVELEGGGKDAFSQLMKTKIYEPFTWHIRHFEEKKTEESHLFFTPNGTPYGFMIKLAETTEKPNLSVHDARKLAQAVASHKWEVNFEKWKEIETSKDTKPCKRTDHTFVYQRTDQKLGKEGEFRLRLVVCGDMVTEVKRFIFVPEAFVRRFEKIRSSNTIISSIANGSLFFLYIFLGCLIAGAFFFRRHLLIVRPAAYWGIGIGALTFLAGINKLPLLWMNYNTATSAHTFLLGNIFSSLVQSCVMGLALTIIFSVCLTWDSLSFPNHLKFWQLWSKDLGASQNTMFLTLFGYAWAIIELGLTCFIYFLLTKYVGWWSPADTLTNPNILATYFPLIEPFVLSLQAGFLEEVLFRALPLAAAFMIGKHFKRERLCLLIGLVIQALIFSGAHANYPQLPGYFRLVELFLPSLIWGLCYIFFGLLPGILFHFLYDFFLMSLPILIAHSYHAWINKGIILFLILIPLFVIGYRFQKRGSWYTPIKKDFNEAFNIKNLFAKTPTNPQHILQTAHVTILSFKRKMVFYCAGLICFILWITSLRLPSDTPAITCLKKDAIAKAHILFEQQQLPLLEWTVLPFIASTISIPEKFVWQTQGKEVFHALLGSYITLPSWAIRFASFVGGNVTERAEEFTALIGPDGNIIRTLRTLPESQPGECLVQGQARGIALTAIEEHYSITTHHLKEISAIEQKKPARTDWTFTFQDTHISLKNDGQARITVIISGDKVTNINRFIFVPEAWQRTEQEKETKGNLIQLLCNILLVALLLFFFIKVQKQLFNPFCIKTTVVTFVILYAFSILSFLNQLPNLKAISFKTSASYESQLLQITLFNLVISALIALALGISISHIKNTITSLSKLTIFEVSILGLSAQCIKSGITTFCLTQGPQNLPLMGDYAYLGTISPLYQTLFSCAQQTLSWLSILVLLFFGIGTLTKHRTQKYFLSALLLMGFGLVSTYINYHQATSLPFVLLTGFCNGIIFFILYYFLFKYDDTIVLTTALAASALTIVHQILLQPYSHALYYGSCTLLLLLIIGVFLIARLRMGLIKK